MEICDSRPIGVFDSGLGGLTAVRELHKLLPNEDIIYFGDNARVPYGTRSANTILKYAGEAIRFLLSHNIKAIVIACGTVSTVAAGTLRVQYSLPIIEVVEPTAKKAVLTTQNKKIALFATSASVRSGAYERTLREFDPLCELTSVACPLLVPLVENGRFEADDQAARMIVGDYLKPVIKSGADTLMLGCTHYPLLSGLIEDLLGQGVKLIDSGAEAARCCAERISGFANHPGHSGQTKYYVSDDVEGFSQAAAPYLRRDVGQSAKWVDLDSFVQT